jgi:hypothetical protein
MKPTILSLCLQHLQDQLEKEVKQTHIETIMNSILKVQVTEASMYNDISDGVGSLMD